MLDKTVGKDLEGFDTLTTGKELREEIGKLEEREEEVWLPLELIIEVEGKPTASLLVWRAVSLLFLSLAFHISLFCLVWSENQQGCVNLIGL